MRALGSWALLFCFAFFWGSIGRAGLVAHYDFGTSSASTANAGTAGTAADGVLINGAQIVDIDPTAGGVEWALQLNNTTGSTLADCQYMNITNGDDSWYDADVPGVTYSPITFAAWVRMDTDTTQVMSMIMSKGYESTFYLGTAEPYNDPGQIVFSYHNGIKGWSPLKSTVSVISDTYWSHVVAVMGEGEGGVCSLYMNGVLQESKTTWKVIVANDLDLLIGAEPNRTAYQYGWNGMIDDVRIYDEFIDAQGVMDLFNDTYSAARPTIPEPATIFLLCLGGLALSGRRGQTW